MFLDRSSRSRTALRQVRESRPNGSHNEQLYGVCVPEEGTGARNVYTYGRRKKRSGFRATISKCPSRSTGTHMGPPQDRRPVIISGTTPRGMRCSNSPISGATRSSCRRSGRPRDATTSSSAGSLHGESAEILGQPHQGNPANMEAAAHGRHAKRSMSTTVGRLKRLGIWEYPGHLHEFGGQSESLLRSQGGIVCTSSSRPGSTLGIRTRRAHSLLPG